MIDFPANPVNGQQFTASGVTYIWNGQGWTVRPVDASTIPVDVYTKAESDAKYVDIIGDVMTGPLAISMADPNLTLNKATGANGFNSLYGKTAGVNRWRVDLGNNVAEAGADVGSNFNLVSYSDDGAASTTVMSAKRDGTEVLFNTDLLKVVGNFALSKIGNAVLTVQATTGFPAVQWVIDLAVMAELDHNGASWNFFTNSLKTTGQYMVNNGQTWVSFSDARLPWKAGAPEVGNVLAHVAQFKLYRNQAPSGKTEVFVKAQELANLFPEVVDIATGPEATNQNYIPEKLGDINGWGVMYDRLGAVALQAIKELLARVEALEAQLANKGTPQ